jgi:hypothetical protein
MRSVKALLKDTHDSLDEDVEMQGTQEASEEPAEELAEEVEESSLAGSTCITYRVWCNFTGIAIPKK